MNIDSRGFSMLETTVALSLLAMGVAGLMTLVMINSRQMERLEEGLHGDSLVYLTPPSSDWARRLGAPATASTNLPGAASPAASAQRSLSIMTFDQDRQAGTLTMEVDSRRATP